MAHEGEAFIMKGMLIPVEEVAQGWLKCDLSYVHKLIKDGKLPFIIIQGSEMIRIYDIVKYIERNLKCYNSGTNIAKLVNNKKEESNEKD